MNSKRRNVILFLLAIALVSACNVTSASPTSSGTTPSPNPSATPEDSCVTNTCVNIEGFHCAISMAINLYEENSSRTTCEDVGVFILSQLKSGFDPQKYRNPDWLVSSVNAYLIKNSLPYAFKYREKLSLDTIRNELVIGNTIIIAIVQLPEMLHAVVIVGHDPQRGLIFLDSLWDGEGLPDEQDFYDKYGKEFQDAWQESYSLNVIQ